MARRRTVTLLAGAFAAAAALGSVPPIATAAQPPPAPCPYRETTPPAVDLSEVPLPGQPAPRPLPLPDEPLGGERMGECGLVLPAGVPAPPPDITAESWIIADVETGEVLAAKDPHARHRPASTIKLLTALVAVDRLDPDTVVIADQADADQEGSSAGIGPGGRYTVRELLAALFMSSGNDAAHALAREMGGLPSAVSAMNARARDLGALDTRAATPSGLDGPGMSTSVYDLALIFREVHRDPLLIDALGTRQILFPGFGTEPGFTLSNDNRLLAEYPGALGGKVGFTDDARHTFLGAAERDGRTLVTVLLRGEQQPVRMHVQASRLLDYGFALPTTGRAAQPVGELVAGSPEDAGPTPTAQTPDGQARPAADAAGDTGGSAPGSWPVWATAGIAVIVLLVGVVFLGTRRGGEPG